MPQNKPTLIIGATPNPARYAYIATEMLLEYDYPVTLFGIKKGNVGDLPILNEWPKDQSFDTITMYINPRIQENYIDDILALNPKRIIFNPGTENPKLEKLARAQNIVALNACTLVLLRTRQY
jgi:predicted CoA-binding protein